MHKIEQEIDSEISSFVQSEGRSPSKIIFPKPKWNDLLQLDANDYGDPIPFIGKDGPQCLKDRKICGLTIEFRGFGKHFTLE